MLEWILLVVVTAVVVVVPGVLLVNACVGAGRLSWLERAYLSVVGGTFLVILVGSLLGLLPHGETGAFSTFRTGPPFVELALAVVSAGLFGIGLRRGAYPSLARRWRIAPGGSEGVRQP